MSGARHRCASRPCRRACRRGRRSRHRAAAGRGRWSWSWIPTLEDDEAVGAGVATSLQRGEARPGADGKLSLEIGYSGDDGAVMARVSYEKDGALSSEVTLFRAESTFGRLDVVQSGLGFDDGVKVASLGGDDAVRATHVAWERDRDLGLPGDVGSEPSGEPFQESDVGLVPHRRADRVDADAQFATEHRRDPRKQIDVDVGSNS